VQVIGRREADIYRTMALESIRGQRGRVPDLARCRREFRESLAERGE